MGTQQILLIVLSVIIVGIAVAVGIQMFQSQAENQNRQAVISDMTTFASEAMAYYKTPSTHGGAGSPTGGWAAGDIDLTDLQYWISGEWGSVDSVGTKNGTYSFYTTDDDDLAIAGVGTEQGNDPAYSYGDFTTNPAGISNGKVSAELKVTPTGDISTKIVN